MNIWVLMFLGGAITFALRFSLIFLLGKIELPESLRRALHYVPPSVLTAIIVPELFLRSGQLELALTNTRLLAGLAALIVALVSKNTLLTILAGMAILALLKLFW